LVYSNSIMKTFLQLIVQVYLEIPVSMITVISKVGCRNFAPWSYSLSFFIWPVNTWTALFVNDWSVVICVYNFLLEKALRFKILNLKVLLHSKFKMIFLN
jgi:hypothetical protein